LLAPRLGIGFISDSNLQDVALASLGETPDLDFVPVDDLALYPAIAFNPRKRLGNCDALIT
jgi:hypothetical protein